MEKGFQLAVLVLFWAVFIIFSGWLFWRALKKSDEPLRLVWKWVITAILLGAMFKMALPVVFQGHQMSVIAGMLMVAALAIIIGITWAPNWASMLVSPLTNAFDGGAEEPEARPVYSAAQAQRNRGRYNEAVAEIRMQLERFPGDFSGQFMLAEILAENLNDLPGAQVTVERIINQPGHGPAQVTAALHALADWHLKYAQDPYTAREALEKIISRFPESQFAQFAAQRIAHLASVDQLLERAEPSAIVMGHYEQNIGLRIKAPAVPEDAVVPETTFGEEAALLVEHLKVHPLDTEAREKLATIYAENYHRCDLARMELEQLIAQPNHSAKEVARWLNRLADFQVREGNDPAAAARTLGQIVERFPGSALADQAQTRMAYLKLEARRNEKPEAIRMGTYEKDLGIKRGVSG